MKPIFPVSRNTNRLPACTSAWNDSHARTDPNHTFNAFTSVSSGSELTPLIASRSVNATPSRNSIVITRLPLYRSYTYGAVATPERSFCSRYLVELKGVRSGVERHRVCRGLKPWGGRRYTPGKVLKKRRSPRQRGRMGASVR
eukprot:31360-Pelagococcus_subviridis.AAC.4